jgi:hypothetical protein
VIYHPPQNRRASSTLRSLPIVLASLRLLAVPAYAQEGDAEGCKDPSLVKRLPGAVVSGCESKDFDEQEFALGYDADGHAKTKKLEGKVERLVYGYGPAASILESTRN